MKYSIATILALATFAVAAPTQQASDEHPQLVHMRSTEDGWANDIYEGDSSEPGLTKEILTRDGQEKCHSTCLAKTMPSMIGEMKAAQDCLINSFLKNPDMSRAERGVAYCRSGKTVVALCANGDIQQGSPLKSDMIREYNQILNENCDKSAGTVFSVPNNVTFWRGAVGDKICPNVKIDGNFGPFKFHVDFSGPRVTIDEA